MNIRRALPAFLALLALGSTPVQADWLRAESPHFVVYGDGAEHWVRRQALLLEDFDKLLRIMTDAREEQSPNKLHVYLVRGKGQLDRIHDVGRDVGGFYSASTGGILAAVDVRSQGVGVEFLLHEYVHHFMHQYAAGSYPAWYVEGLAEYYSTVEFDDEHILIGRLPQAFSNAVSGSRWLPMEQVLFRSVSDQSTSDRFRFYAQSWLATHYFTSTRERRQMLRQYLAAIFGGADPREAFEAETGFTAREFQSELRKYIRGRRIAGFQLPRESVGVPPEVEVTVLPRSATPLLLHQAALRIGIAKESLERELRRIRNAAARHEGDEFAQRVLAHAEALYGDPAVADRLLDSLLATQPDDAELLYLKGMRHLIAAEAGPERERELLAAREWFGRAYSADDNHFPTLYRFTQTLRDDPRYISDNNANAILLALQLAPQVPSIRREAAVVMLKRHDLKVAHAVLMPLATDPHRPEMAEWASGRIEWVLAQTQSMVSEAQD